MADLRPRILTIVSILFLVVLAALSSYADSGPIALQSGNPDFGPVTVGEVSTARLTFQFNDNVTIGVYVVTQGYQGADFVRMATPSGCLAASYLAGNTCTVDVSFTPKYPGVRMGAVVFVDSSATVISTTYLRGVGSGSLPDLSAGVSSTGFSFRLTGAVAVDAAGKKYVGGVQSNGYVGVWEVGAVGGSIADGISYANAAAIDGAGNFYVLDWSSRQCGVWQITPSWANRTTSCYWAPSWSDPSIDLGSALAVDGAGNVYVADQNAGAVLKIAPGGTLTTFASGFAYIAALAIGPEDELYVADWGRTCDSLINLSGYFCSGNNRVWKVSGGTKIPVFDSTGLGYGPDSLALDGVGQLYILDGSALWKMVSPSAAQALDIAGLGLADWNPSEIVVDGPGNAYVTDGTTLYTLSGINSAALLPPAVDGQCGAANNQTLDTTPAQPADLCTEGTPSAVTGSGPWRWSCGGLNGGGTTSCSAKATPSPINGACGPANQSSLNAPPAQSQLCAAGAATAITGSGPWDWSCTGLNGGTAASCSAGLSNTGAVDGVCSAADGLSFTQKPQGDLCLAGTASDVTGPSDWTGPWSWSCEGLRGGATASCSARDADHACGSGTFGTLGGGKDPISGVAVDGAGTVYWSSCPANEYENGQPYNNSISTSLGTVVDEQWIGIWTAAGNRNLYISADTVLYEAFGARRIVPGESDNWRRTGCSLYSEYTPVADSAANVYSIRSGWIQYDINNRWYYAEPATVWSKHPTDYDCAETIAAGAGTGCAEQTDQFGNGCLASKANLVSPGALAMDPEDNLYIFDNTSQPSGYPNTWDHYRCAIRRVDGATHRITSLPLDFSMSGGDCWDGPTPSALAVGPDHNFYFTAWKRVWKVDAITGLITGIKVPSPSRDYVGIALDNYGNLYLADKGKTTLTVVKDVARGTGNCSTLTPVNAECGWANQETWTSAEWTDNASDSQWLCYQGTASSVTGSGPWSWSCKGSNYGRTASCSASRAGGGQENQTITFPNPGSRTYGTSPFALEAAATSGLTVTYSVTSGPATVTGSTLTITGAGTVTVQATQAGDANWLAADPVNVSFIVSPAALSVTTYDKERIYGTANPSLDGVLTGVIPGDGITASYTTTATQASGAGTYPIVPTLNDPNNKLGNYTPNLINGTILVKRAALNVVADDKKMNFGSAVPPLTASYSGFVNGDSAAVLMGTPQLATTATSISPAGTYPITVAVGTLVAANYDFVFINGKMTVLVVPPTVQLSTSLSSLVRQADGSYTAMVKITSTGTAAANNVTLTTAVLGGKSGTPLPQLLGSLAPGAFATATLNFPASAGGPGTTVVLSVGGTYLGGSFQANMRAVLR